MRIGINTALLESGGGYRQTGVSRYIQGLIQGLTTELGEDDTIVPFRGVSAIRRRPAARIAWEQVGMPPLAVARRIEVFHGPLNVAPIIPRIPTVITVHDLAFLRYPDQLPAARRTYMVIATRVSARLASRVIAVSERTAQDLLEWTGIPTERIRVIPEAPSDSVARVTGTSLDVFRMRHAAGRPYFLAVGTHEPRKNLPFLLRAFSSIRERVPHDLVLVGPKGWLTSEIDATVRDLDLGDRLRMTGFVTDTELGGWYSAADCLVYPSLYEGFGLPTVEAMACGTPVLASSTSCFPEVVGEAGLLVDPRDGSGWQDALVRIAHDAGLKAELGRRSLERATAFNWQRTARETLAVYREAVS